MRQAGFEPAAYGLEGRCSIQLSYWRGEDGMKQEQLYRAGQRKSTLISGSLVAGMAGLVLLPDRAAGGLQLGVDCAAFRRCQPPQRDYGCVADQGEEVHQNKSGKRSCGSCEFKRWGMFPTYTRWLFAQFRWNDGLCRLCETLPSLGIVLPSREIALVKSLPYPHRDSCRTSFNPVGLDSVISS